MVLEDYLNVMTHNENRIEIVAEPIGKKLMAVFLMVIGGLGTMPTLIGPRNWDFRIIQFLIFSPMLFLGYWLYRNAPHLIVIFEKNRNGITFKMGERIEFILLPDVAFKVHKVVAPKLSKQYTIRIIGDIFGRKSISIPCSGTDTVALEVISRALYDFVGEPSKYNTRSNGFSG